MTAHTVPKVPMVPTEQGPGPLAMPMALVHGSQCKATGMAPSLVLLGTVTYWTD